MDDVVHVSPSDGFDESFRPPGDKSISHRVVMLAGLTQGVSHLSGVSDGDDVGRTRAAVEAIGATCSGGQGPDDVLVVHGVGEHPNLSLGNVDCGNSGTSMRLLAGLLAGQGIAATLVGDESLLRRPMDRVVLPLRELGAELTGEDERHLPPVRLLSTSLLGARIVSSTASAQVKGAVLLAGLGAHGRTTLVERVPTRPHTEELLPIFGVDVQIAMGDEVTEISIDGPAKLSAADVVVPVDPSQVAFMAVAAAISPGSTATFRNVYVGGGRGEVFEVLRELGARVDIRFDDAGKPSIATVTVSAGELLPLRLGDERIASLIDELPVLAVALACADGVSEIRDAAELRVKESDRIASIVRMMQAFGVPVVEFDDGVQINGRGGRRLSGGGTIEADGDHRIAMSAAVGALRADGPTTITGWSAVATSYPSFDKDLDRCR